jgi:hypothetical protein
VRKDAQADFVVLAVIGILARRVQRMRNTACEPVGAGHTPTTRQHTQQSDSPVRYLRIAGTETRRDRRRVGALYDTVRWRLSCHYMRNACVWKHRDRTGALFCVRA